MIDWTLSSSDKSFSSMSPMQWGLQSLLVSKAGSKQIQLHPPCDPFLFSHTVWQADSPPPITQSAAFIFSVHQDSLVAVKLMNLLDLHQGQVDSTPTLHLKCCHLHPGLSVSFSQSPSMLFYHSHRTNGAEPFERVMHVACNVWTASTALQLCELYSCGLFACLELLPVVASGSSSSPNLILLAKKSYLNRNPRHFRVLHMLPFWPIRTLQFP